MDIVKNGTFSGYCGNNHCQGVAVDIKNDRIYYSFTTKLVATKLDGTPVGSATGIIGHLGCIAFNEEDGLVYGSLEFKHDSIGRGIAAKGNGNLSFKDGFYIAIFDGLKITEENMDAAQGGIMTAAFLSEVLDDYEGKGRKMKPHRYGCSGIDGTTFAPLPGDANGKKYLYVAYGIYKDILRGDNDNQILLCYDAAALKESAKPLNQDDMHRSGPEKPLHKFYAYTGNTNWGVQNLCYDSKTKMMFLAVYRGSKKKFINYDIFAVNMTKAAQDLVPPGLKHEHEMLTLFGSSGPADDNICGWDCSCGQYGMPSFGDGTFLFAEPGEENGENFARVYNYSFSFEKGFTKE